MKLAFGCHLSVFDWFLMTFWHFSDGQLCQIANKNEELWDTVFVPWWKFELLLWLTPLTGPVFGFCLCLKMSLHAKSFIRNVFSPRVHFEANQSVLLMKGFARGLTFKPRHKSTRRNGQLTEVIKELSKQYEMMLPQKRYCRRTTSK